MFGLAVRDSTDLRLIARIRRSKSGIYYLMPRNERGWDPHASYHADGTRHVRMHGEKSFVTSHQPLGDSFKGVVPFFWESIQPGEIRYTRPFDRSRFTDVFEIGATAFSPTEVRVIAVDLSEPGGSALLGPSTDVIAQHVFRDAIPWILVTVWRGPSVTPLGAVHG